MVSLFYHELYRLSKYLITRKINKMRLVAKPSCLFLNTIDEEKYVTRKKSMISIKIINSDDGVILNKI